jgi:hypothetical protein
MSDEREDRRQKVGSKQSAVEGFSPTYHIPPTTY